MRGKLEGESFFICTTSDIFEQTLKITFWHMLQSIRLRQKTYLSKMRYY